MIKITADSTCDLSQELLDQWSISLSPLSVVVDGQAFHDGVDIVPEDIFRFVEEGKNCSTAAVNHLEYYQFFKKQLEDHDGLVHISLSSALSSSHENAQMAASMFENVVVIDSQNLSTGSGLLVLEAAHLAREGLSPAKIKNAVEEKVSLAEASFVVSNIDYLYNGGRCNAVEATGAKLLKIKPSIEVENGKMHPGKKYRGSYLRCIEHYIEDRLANRNDIDPETIFITHCACDKETVSRAKELVSSLYPFKNIYTTQAGCTIACHCGPVTLGILFFKKNS